MMQEADEPQNVIDPPPLGEFKRKLTNAMPVEFLMKLLRDVQFRERQNSEWKAHRQFIEDLLRMRGIRF